MEICCRVSLNSPPSYFKLMFAIRVGFFLNMVTYILLQSKSKEERKLRVLVNDWVDVQDGCYRYLAIDDYSGVTIRIVIAEYMACEVWWNIYA